jgi:hypothetical protein
MKMSQESYVIILGNDFVQKSLLVDEVVNPKNLV